MEIEVRGADVARRLARDLNRTSLRGDAAKALRKAAPKMIRNSKRNARRILPRGGGLGKRVAGSGFTVTDHSGGSIAHVRITATSDIEIDNIDEGVVHHPTYGRWLRIYPQRVPAGWFTDSMRSDARVVRHELDRVPHAVSRRLG